MRIEPKEKLLEAHGHLRSVLYMWHGGERFFHVTDLDGYKLRFAGVPAFRVPRSDANPLVAWRYNLCRWRTL
jgi:hypothetical protein